MTTKLTTTFPKAKIQTDLHINLLDIINSHNELSIFFQERASTKQQFHNLAKELLIYAFQSKKDSPKRYNVSYIKHNRFLSPTQKRQVTAKVTQMIPVSPQKLVIYGKPKVVLDNGVGCPLHQNLCPEQQNNQSKKTTANAYPTRDYQQDEQQEDLQFLRKKYDTHNQIEIQSPIQNKTLPSQVRNSKKSKKSQKLQETINIKSRITSPNNYANITSNSNKYRQNQSKIVSSRGKHTNRCCQNYDNIQSKIKFLIDRDKQNKVLQKKLDEQKGQIQQIQNRQKNLLLHQKSQKNFIKNSSSIQHNLQNQTSYRQTRPKIVIPYDDSDSFSSSDLSCLQIAKIHKHITKAERLRCYQCELQRLKRQKERAKKSIMNLHRDYRKKSAYEYSCGIESQSESSYI